MNDIDCVDNYIVKDEPVWKIDKSEFEKLALAKTLFIPSKVQTIIIGDSALIEWREFLNSIEVDENNKFYYSNGSNAIIERASQKLILGCKNTVIPDEVKIIGINAFRNSSIEKIVIPGSVERIGEDAFSYCTNLKEVTIKEGAKEIGNSAFYGTNIEKIVIPGSVEKIENDAFLFCGKLKEVTIKEGVKEIGNSAFVNCINLRKIEIPSSVEKIGKYAFDNCWIEKIDVNENNKVYYSNGNAIIERASQKLILGCTNTVIPNEVKIIGDYAFFGTAIEKTEIPSSVEKIGDFAFSDCEYLKEITIKEGVKEIGNSAFYKCINLEKIEIPGSVEKIGEYACLYCEKLKKIIIKEGVKEIGEFAFSNCDIEEIVIPSSVSIIKSAAFKECKKVKSVKILGKTKICDYAFENCYSLKEVSQSNKCSCEIEKRAFTGCNLIKNKK